jgi:PucR family transcriptional regulator, purine catabolism regulatory protein
VASRFVEASPTYSVKVAEILRLALPPETSVLAGQRLLGRSVHWARMLGARHGAIGPREAGEMILLPTAGLSDGAFERTIRDLADAGVGALLVSGDPPTGGLDVAEEVGTPILRLPPTESLLEAERSIVSFIVDRDSQVRRRVEHVYERLLATLVDDKGVGSLAGEVARVTGRPTVVLDEYFRVQDSEPNGESTREFGEALGTALSSRTPRPGSRPTPATFRLTIGRGGIESLVVPLELRGTPAGYLALGGDEEFSELDVQITERAARVLGIELVKQRAVTEAQLRMQGDLLEDLFAGHYPSEEALIARGRWMGHSLTRPHVILVLAVDSSTDGAASEESRRMREADIARTELVRLEPDALLREHQGAFALAVPRASELTRQESIDLAEHLRGRIESVLRGANVTVGVGRAHPGVSGMALAYREASQALAIGRVLLGGGVTAHFEDLGVQRLLFQLRDSAELASFYDDMLGRLQEHDERQGADLVNTLEAFFECHGNHVRTAQMLHLHRNTLLYRLDRARQVLDVDFDDAEVRLALQVALKIGRVVGRRPISRARRSGTESRARA